MAGADEQLDILYMAAFLINNLQEFVPNKGIWAQNKMKSYLEGHPITRWGRAPYKGEGGDTLQPSYRKYSFFLCTDCEL